MRGSLGKAVRVAFEKGLKQRLSKAVNVPLSESSGSKAWLVGENEKASAYVILVLSVHQNDRFTVELAWSQKKRIPPHTGQIPGEAGDSGELRFRLSRLWQPSGFEVWYDLQYGADHPESGPSSVFTPEAECLRRVPPR